MAEVHLVCEGQLDLQVLDRLVVQRFGLNVIVTPVGGEGNVGGVAGWFVDRSRKTDLDGKPGPPTDRVYTIQDRDYRASAECEASWRPANMRFIWHRHEIENYLLDPRVVADAFSALRISAAKWPKSLPENVAEVESLLQQLARPLLENHAGWLTYWRLDRVKKSVGSTRFAWPDDLKPSRSLRYPGRIDWLNHFMLEAQRAREASSAFVKLEAFEAEAIRKEYDRILAEISSVEFFSTGQYLVDLSGHDLMSTLIHHINILQCPLSLIDFEDQLLKSLDQQYTPNFFVPDEFAELARRLI